MSEKRALKAHKNLLMDVIRRQAGTVSKAILEGVMNSIDAEAESCEITLDKDTLRIKDDGKGLQDLSFFETFGQPHEEGDATYGTFRMGRGQLFAFGRNVWKTAQYHLDVDVKNKGLDYVCKEYDDKNEFPGCDIVVEFYERLDRVTLAGVEAELKAFVKYAQIPVYYNGDKINKNVEKVSWQHETEDYYAKFANQGSLSIYNLGVLVCEKPYYVNSIGGEIVSKKQLKVNFARNDVMSDCPVWRKLKPVINEAAGKKTKRRDDDEDRLHYAGKMDNGALDASQLRELFYRKKSITDVRGRHHTPASIYRWDKITAADTGTRSGDVLMQQKMAFVLSIDTLNRFGVDSVPEFLEFLRKIRSRIAYDHCGDPEYVAFSELSEKYVDDYRTVDEKTLTAKERIWLQLCSAMMITKDGRYHFRKVVMGESDEAVAMWTDGGSNIWVNRRWIAAKDYAKLKDVMEVGITLVHEYSHDDDSKNTDEHGPEFKERFSDLMERTDVLGRWIDEVMKLLPKASETHMNRQTKKVAKLLDKVEKYGGQSGRIKKHERELASRLAGTFTPGPKFEKRTRKGGSASKKAACGSDS